MPRLTTACAPPLTSFARGRLAFTGSVRRAPEPTELMIVPASSLRPLTAPEAVDRAVMEIESVLCAATSFVSMTASTLMHAVGRELWRDGLVERNQLVTGAHRAAAIVVEVQRSDYRRRSDAALRQRHAIGRIAGVADAKSTRDLLARADSFRRRQSHQA